MRRLAEAKRVVHAEDTPAARARMSRCAATVHAILDLSNDCVYARPVTDRPADSTAANPIGPAPMMTTVSPGRTPPLRAPTS